MAQANKKPRKKAANGYKMPDPIAKGEILTDVARKQWRLGNSIGKGGFGEIYEAQEASKASTKFPYAIKVEPHENGPLFVEIHFYMKNAKQADIEDFKSRHKLQTFGMPAYIGSGRYEASSQCKYRFIVMEKFGNDVDKMRKDKGGLPWSTVSRLASQIVYVLEYIHEQGYIHGDIKGGNVLMGITSESKNQAYLVDFGLATKFSTEKEFKPNPKKAHDGTLEYTSRDAHLGVPTRRGDLEILGYNIIHWLGGTLPWDSKLGDPKTVQFLKESAMDDIPGFLESCFKSKKSVDLKILTKYFQAINKLSFNEQPQYQKIRKLLEDKVESGATPTGATRKRRIATGNVTPDSTTTEKEAKKPAARGRKEREVQTDEVELHAGEPMNDAMREILAKKTKNGAKKKKAKSPIKPREESDAENEDFNGYTAAMIEIKQKKLNNAKTTKPKKKVVSQDVDEDSSRPRRLRPAINYDESTPKLPRKKGG